MENKIESREKLIVDTILGGKVDDGMPEYIGTKKDAKLHEKIQAIKTPDEEKITITTNSGEKKEIVLCRKGTTERALGELLLDKNTDTDKKNAMLASYLFEKGKESASFIADLMVYKGSHTKETRAFKTQMRFDFEAFANMMVLGMHDISKGINKDMEDSKELKEVVQNMSDRFNSLANTISNRVNAIKESRMRDKGYGIYINGQGKAYSIFDDKVFEEIDRERKEWEEEHKDEN